MGPPEDFYQCKVGGEFQVQNDISFIVVIDLKTNLPNAHRWMNRYIAYEN